MKSKKYKIIAFLITLMIGQVGISVNASDVGSNDSKGTITYTPSTDPTNPVDPTDPTKPVKPVDPLDPNIPISPGTPGPLSIDFASTFDFGIQKITSEDKTYFAGAQNFNDGSTGPNYVQMTDNRGTLSGWGLSIKQNSQFSTGIRGGTFHLMEQK